MGLQRSVVWCHDAVCVAALAMKSVEEAANMMVLPRWAHGQRLSFRCEERHVHGGQLHVRRDKRHWQDFKLHRGITQGSVTDSEHVLMLTVAQPLVPIAPGADQSSFLSYSSGVLTASRGVSQLTAWSP